MDSTTNSPIHKKPLWARTMPPSVPRAEIDTNFVKRIRLPGTPSLSSTLRISQIIQVAKQDLDEYDTDISYLENIVRSTKEKRESLQQYVSQCEYYLAPIRKLPPELLTEIFYFYQDIVHPEPDIWETLGSGDPERPQTAIVLSSVCSHWRQIALSTPRLWSRFSVVLESEFESEPVYEMAQIYLNRSHPRPLSIDIRMDGYTEHGPTLELLVNHSHRWQKISFDIGFLTSEVESSLNERKELPMLNDLKLHFDWFPSHRETTFYLFSQAFELSALSCPLNVIRSTNMSWCQLRNLDLQLGRTRDRDTFEELKEILQQCTSLMSLTFYVGIALIEPHDPTCQIPLLEELIFRSGSLMTMNQVLDNLTLPSLKKLSLIDIANPNLDPPPPLTITLSCLCSRSECSLSSLELKEISDQDVSAIELLRLHPTITELFLCDVTYPPERPEEEAVITRTLLEALSVRESNPILVPNLKKLAVQVNGARNDFDDSVFAAMLESRWNLPLSLSEDSRDSSETKQNKAFRTLQSVDFELAGRNMRDDLSHRLEKLKKAGMDLVVNLTEKIVYK